MQLHPLHFRTIAIALLLPFALLAQDGKGKDTPAKKEKIDFEKQVLPILEKNCLECHRAPFTDKDGKTKKPKGGVILETKDAILAGKKGKLLQPKKPDSSLLYTVTVLAADDEDRMPPAKKGDPLPKEETDLLKQWIEEGAEFGKWTGKKEGDDKGKGKGDKDKPKEGATPPGGDKGKKDDLRLVELARDLPPAPAEALAGLAAVHGHATSIGDGSPLLDVQFTGHEDATGDAAVAALLPLRQHIAFLRLGRTAVTDAVGATLAQMPNLVRLDLRETQIGDAGVQQLAACQHLTTLNLFGTRVGDTGVQALAGMPSLQKLWLWQTEVAATTVQGLRERLPGLQVVSAAELPEPMAAANGGNRRRARK